MPSISDWWFLTNQPKIENTRKSGFSVSQKSFAFLVIFEVVKTQKSFSQPNENQEFSGVLLNKTFLNLIPF